MSDELLRVSDAVKETRLHRATIQRAIKAGELRVFRFGRAIRIDRRDLQAWIASKGADGKRAA